MVNKRRQRRAGTKSAMNDTASRRVHCTPRLGDVNYGDSLDRRRNSMADVDRAVFIAARIRWTSMSRYCEFARSSNVPTLADKPENGSSGSTASRRTYQSQTGEGTRYSLAVSRSTPTHILRSESVTISIARQHFCLERWRQAPKDDEGDKQCLSLYWNRIHRHCATTAVVLLKYPSLLTFIQPNRRETEDLDLLRL